MDNLTPPGGIRRIEANRTVKDAIEAAVRIIAPGNGFLLLTSSIRCNPTFNGLERT